MLKKTILFAVVAGLVLALVPTAVMAWTPPGPPPRGDENVTDGTPNAGSRAPVPPASGYPDAYRLMYVTSGGYDADQTDINWYNNEVNTVANSGSSSVIGLTTWKMYGATAASPNARVNTGMLLPADPGYTAACDVPIFNFAGSMLALNNTEFWATNLFTIDTTDGIFDNLSYEDGSETRDVSGVNGDVYSAWWAGMTQDGIAVTGYELGAEYVTRGLGYKNASAQAQRWTDWGGRLKATGVPNRIASDGNLQWIDDYPRLRGVSDVIPEPVTMTLLAFGGLGVLLRRKRR